jgi:von Willebrand factor type A domain-containing protein
MRGEARKWSCAGGVSIAAGVFFAILGACDSSSTSESAAKCPYGDCSDLGDFDPGTTQPDGTCAKVEVKFEKRIPYVVLLVDQSGSMTADFGNGTRWSVLHDALLNPNDGIVTKLDEDVRFGLALYTSMNGYEGGTCPLVTGIEAEFGTYTAIKTLYDASEPIEDTPTGESILAVAEQLQKIYLSVPTPKVIVLATDGEPDTCEQPDPENGQEKSIEAAKAAWQMGISTYVISVGDEVGLGHLQDMANAGQGLEVGGGQNAPFYQALDQDQLYDAFDTIINGVRDCVFTLDGNVVPGYEDQGKVVLDGESLPQDDPNGWKLNSSNEIQLLGEACEKIQNGEHELDVEFPCGGYDPPPVK